MAKSRTTTLWLLWTTVATAAAYAGPNEGGYLLFHTDDNVVYTQDDSEIYCQLEIVDCPPDPDGPPHGDEQDCQASIHALNPTSGIGGARTLAWVIAAFPTGRYPRVTSVAFGLDWSGEGDEFPIVDYGGCANFELADDGWPQRQSGTSLFWNSTRTNQAFQIYWIAGYAYYGPLELKLAEHPSSGAMFWDDSVPAETDEILPQNLGILGLNGAMGTSPFEDQIDYGACCFQSGSCLLYDIETCDSAQGEFLGNGVFCTPNPCRQPGACCLPTIWSPYIECSVRSETQCVGSGGEYIGDETSCDPDPCPIPVLGACCNIETGSCRLTPVWACESLDDNYLGDDVPCDPNPCPQPVGACCLDSGSCLVGYRQSCFDFGGRFQGRDTVCDPNPCPQPGACCFEDGSCEVRLESECHTGGYQGDESSCDPNPCPQPGGCCFADGSCEYLHPSQCDDDDGTYLGSGIPCAPNPCPQPAGACCLPIGECIQVPQEACLDSNGAYYGDGSTCDPDPCPVPRGACCFADLGCLVGTEAACQDFGGDYQGNGTVCDPNPCTAAGVPGNALLPNRAVLTQPSPNPSQGAVEFTVGLPKAASVRLRVFDANGRLVETIVDGRMEAGLRRLSWSGESQSSGVYFVELRTATGTISRSFALVR